MPDGRERVEELQALAERLGFEIRDVSLYDRALTHASRQSEGEVAGYDYESLEFLGDAVLGLAWARGRSSPGDGNGWRCWPIAWRR